MTSAQSTVQRRQRIAARKAQILDAAAKVFAEKGFHRATTKEVAEAANVSEGTIYNYFDSKADLLIGIMAHLAEFDRVEVEMREPSQGDSQDFFLAVLRERMGRIQQGQDILQAVLPEVLVHQELRERFYHQHIQPIIGLLEQYLRARIELGHIRSVNVPLTVRAVQGMFVGLLVLRILGDKPIHVRWDDLPEVLATLVFDGLSPREGA